MSEKTRTTVTTIETHEVWVIRTPAPQRRDDVVTITPLKETLPDAAVSSSSEPDLVSEGRSETSKEPES
jgi:hypothetical protein